MTGGRARRAGVALIILGVIGLAGSLPVMAVRLSQRQTSVVWSESPVLAPEFELFGRPAAVRFVEPDGAEPPRIRVEWRGETLEYDIEPGMLDDPRLPGLLRFGDWLTVLPFAEGARTEQELRRGLSDASITPRLAVVMRLPARDVDPGTWGQVNRRNWRYRLVELLPPSEPETFRVHESTYRELERLGDQDWRIANGREADAWMYSAMMRVTPSTLFRSRNRPIESAMNAMGWAWPVAGLSCMLLVVGGILVAASGVERAGDEDGSALR